MSRFPRRLQPLVAVALAIFSAAALALAVRAFTFHTEMCLFTRGCWEQPLTTGAKVTGTVALSVAVVLVVSAAVLALRLFRSIHRAADRSHWP